MMHFRFGRKPQMLSVFWHSCFSVHPPAPTRPHPYSSVILVDELPLLTLKSGSTSEEKAAFPGLCCLGACSWETSRAPENVLAAELEK